MLMQNNNKMESASESWHFSVINKKGLITYALVVLIGILYALEIKFIGYSIPCAFYLITGYKCPGCGITRLIIALLHLDFKGAFYSNPFIFITLPLLIYFLIKNMIINCGIIKGRFTKIENGILYVYVFLLIIFGILRNVFEKNGFLL